MADSPTVAIGYVNENDVAHSFTDSYVRALLHDGGNTVRNVIKVRGVTGQMDVCRNQVAEEFLGLDNEWLWSIDTDMGFAPDTLENLLLYGDPDERPIIGALTFAQKEVEDDGLSGHVCKARPVIIDKVPIEENGVSGERYVGRGWYAPNVLTRCASTGMACVVIHRSVFEKVKEAFGEHWYDRLPGIGPDADKLMGEDVSFFHRCGELDIPVHVHAAVRTTHLKPVWVNEADFWQQQVPDPATDRVLVAVPVLHRPANAKPFMQSLRASTGMADVVAVADEDDLLTIAAWQEQGVKVLTGPEHTFSEKLNRAYRDAMNGQKWLFMCGDDVQFYPGWLDHAEWMGNSFHAKVVGTNDLGNPRVMAGEHGTHLLIDREYIDEVGASWDGPKVVAHEGYRHWFVDDEIVTAARQRNVWVAALGSIVEHLHFLWEKSQVDSTYEEGQAHAEEDRQEFQKRLREFVGEPGNAG